MNIFQTYKEQGGNKLFKQFAKTHSLFITLCEVLSLGRSRTSLEIVRLSAQLKTKQYLEKKFRKQIVKYGNRYRDVSPGQHKKVVWICWLQGIENAPQIVKICYESLRKNITDRDIVVITDENYSDYVDFPPHILEKYENGIITRTHFSDLLRIELLCRYGGSWIDATVFCSSSVYPSYMLDSDLFMFQNLKPGRDGQTLNYSSWFMTAVPNSRTLLMTRDLIYDYWKKNESLLDYFLLHYFMEISFDYFPDDRKKILPYANSTSHILLLNFFEKYNENFYREMLLSCPFHKMSYKFSDEKLSLEGTYYKRFIKDYHV